MDKITAMVQAVLAYALAHYEEGWDVVVETVDELTLRTILRDAGMTTDADAIKLCEMTFVEPWLEGQANAFCGEARDDYRAAERDAYDPEWEEMLSDMDAQNPPNWARPEDQREEWETSSTTEWDRADAVQRGSEDPTRPWVLTDRDVWHRNPYYSGPPVPHPEDDEAWERMERERQVSQREEDHWNLMMERAERHPY